MRRDRTLLRQLTANHRASPGTREREREKKKWFERSVDEKRGTATGHVSFSVTLSSSCAVLGIFSRAPKSSPRNPGLERREWGREGGGEALRDPCSTGAKFGTRLVSNVARLGAGRERERERELAT